MTVSHQQNVFTVMTEFAHIHDTPSQWLADIVNAALQKQEQENRNKTTLTLRLTELERMYVCK